MIHIFDFIESVGGGKLWNTIIEGIHLVLRELLSVIRKDGRKEAPG